MDQLTAFFIGVGIVLLGACLVALAALGYFHWAIDEAAFYMGAFAIIGGLGTAFAAAEEEYLWRHGRRVPRWKC